MSKPVVAIVMASKLPERVEFAAKLACRLGACAAGPDDAEVGLQLVVADRRLELRDAAGQSGPVYVDFVGGRMGVRRRGGWSRDPLVRAMGRKHAGRRVVDATAGLGRDAFMLAVAGCRVTAVERSPVMATLLEDGLARAERDARLGPIVIERLSLVEADARTYLASLAEPDWPDVVYIDPMFPPRGKTALSKKEMRICRAVAGDDLDAAGLFEVARGVARDRVVVKRWLHARPLAGRPSAQLEGQSIRYDVYLSSELRTQSESG